MGVLGHFALDHVEVETLNLLGDRANLAVTDFALVDAADRSNLGCRAAEECLFAAIQLGSVYDSLLNFKPQLVSSQFDDAVAGDAFEDVLGGGWGDQLALAHQEDVHGAAFADVAVLGERDDFVIALALGVGNHNGGVHVGAAGFCRGGDGVVIHPAPGGYANVQAGGADVVAQGVRPDGVVGLHLVEVRANGHAVLVKGKANVEVLIGFILANQLGGQVHQLVQRGFRGHEEDA